MINCVKVQAQLFVFNLATIGVFKAIYGIGVKFKNFFGTYLCRQWTSILEVQPYLFVYNSATFETAIVNTDPVIDDNGMKFTKIEKYISTLHERPVNFVKTGKCSFKTVKTVECSINYTVNISTRKSDQISMKNGRILSSETTRVEPEKVDQKSATWNLKRIKFLWKMANLSKMHCFCRYIPVSLILKKIKRLKRTI